MREEPVLPLPSPRQHVPPATHFRSTWVVSSIQTLRARGHYERYVERLDAAVREEVLHLVAGAWIPVGLARAHYEACDRLCLTIDEQLAMGRAVGDRAQGSMLSSAVRTARVVAEASPWTILPQMDRVWRRGANGGAAAVYRIGPKEARVEIVGCELFDVDYFRTAFRAVLIGLSPLFCDRSFIHEMPTRGRGEVHLKLQWV